MPAIELAASWELVDDLDAQIGWRRVRARLLAQQGDFEQGERLAREATDLAVRTDFRDNHARVLVDLAEVPRLAGRAQESRAALEEAIGLFEHKGNVAGAACVRTALAEVSVESSRA